MTSIAENYLTPVGRLVQGDCFVPQTKDQKGNPLVVKKGPNAGQPTKKFFVAVAFKKGDPAFETFRARLEANARANFPALFPNAGPCINPKFAYKVIDGDGYDDNGKHNATKEGFAGHWVLRCSSSYPPRCFRAGHHAPHEQMQDPKSIPRGHYVRIAGQHSGNEDLQKPGMFVNLDLVEWCAVGDVITSGPDASQVFGGDNAYGGAGGAVGAPTMTAKAAGVTYESYRASGWTDAQLIEGGYMIAAAPAPAAAPPAPNAAPPAPAAPPSPVAATPHPTILQGGPTMTAKAAGVTYESYRASGWTDAQLIEGGYMIAAAPAPAAAPPAPNAAPPAPAAPPSPSAPRSPQDRMTASANGVTYAAYKAGNWTDEQLIANGFMLPA